MSLPHSPTSSSSASSSSPRFGLSVQLVVLPAYSAMLCSGCEDDRVRTYGGGALVMLSTLLVEIQGVQTMPMCSRSRRTAEAAFARCIRWLSRISGWLRCRLLGGGFSATIAPIKVQFLTPGREFSVRVDFCVSVRCLNVSFGVARAADLVV